MERMGIAKISGVWWFQGEYACCAATVPRVPSEKHPYRRVKPCAVSVWNYKWPDSLVSRRKYSTGYATQYASYWL